LVSKYSSGEVKVAELPSVAFLGGSRYAQPLDSTHEKKFWALQPLARLFIIGFSEDLIPRIFTQHARFYLLPQLPVTMLRYVEFLTIGFAIALWLIWQKQVRVLVAQTPHEGAAAAAAKQVASWFGCRVVLVIESHGDFETYLFLQRSVPFPKLYSWLMQQVARFALDQADLLRGVSQATSQQLRQWAPDRPLFQFTAWTDIETFLQAAATKPASTQTILYAGVLIPRKGVLHLVNAFAQIAASFPQARLTVVGRETNVAYVTELKARVQQLQLGDRIQFLPHVTQTELANHMAQASVFVLPSFSEGLVRVVLEAMATGTPVIGTAIDGIQELIRVGETGFLIAPADETALAERLRWFLEHPDEASQMGDRAYHFAQQFFSSAIYVQGYQEVFATAQTILKTGKVNHASSPF
jgi:glycosyltransferase involved in cell wall biosynthesis